MNHKITKFVFGEKSKRPWGIEHEHNPMAARITTNEGDFLLFMDGMPCGMCLPGPSVRFVSIETDGEKLSVFANYTGRRGLPDQYDDRLGLGECTDMSLLPEALRFVREINQAFYRR